MTELKVIEKVVDICAKQQLDILAPNLPASCTKAEMLSHCMNTELGAYGLTTHVSPDKLSVFIDDEGMSKVFDFLYNRGYQPVLTPEHTDRVGTLIDYANKNKIDILWGQSGLKRKYYMFKQYGFNGVNLYNLLNINTINTAAATASASGAAAITMAGVVALSWSGSLFFSSLENYIPHTMPRTKIVVSGLKYGVALPIRCVEWTSNQIIGFVENVTVGYQLPINVTEAYRLSIGPKLENINKIKKPALGWLINQLERLNK